MPRRKLPESQPEYTQTFYEIKTHPYTFHAIVYENHDRGQTFIRFGGKKACVHLSIYKGEPNPYLMGLGRGHECSMSDEPPRADTVRLLKAALVFMYEIFTDRHLSDTQLKDTSSISCSSDVMVNLMALYLGKHLQSWYQAKFGAELDSSSEGLQSGLARLQDPSEKAAMTFPDFVKRWLKPHIQSSRRLQKIIELIEPYYQRTHTLHEFMASLDEYDCEVFDGWLEALVMSLFSTDLRSSLWRITMERVNAFPRVTIRPIDEKPAFPGFVSQGGGGGSSTWDANMKNEARQHRKSGPLPVCYTSI